MKVGLCTEIKELSFVPSRGLIVAAVDVLPSHLDKHVNDSMSDVSVIKIDDKILLILEIVELSIKDFSGYCSIDLPEV